MQVGSVQSQPRRRVEQFSGVPWDVLIARNPVINRLAIDLIGMETFSLTFARHKYERIDRAMDFGFRLAIGFACFKWSLNSKSL